MKRNLKAVSLLRIAARGGAAASGDAQLSRRHILTPMTNMGIRTDSSLSTKDSCVSMLRVSSKATRGTITASSAHRSRTSGLTGWVINIAVTSLNLFGTSHTQVSARFLPPGLDEELANNDRRRIVKMAQQ